MKAIQVGDTIRNVASKVQFFQLDQPMVFEESAKIPGIPASVDSYSESAWVAICCFRGIVPRTVIHAATPLKGEKGGFAYGGSGARIIDGISNADTALMLQGYIPE